MTNTDHKQLDLVPPPDGPVYELYCGRYPSGEPLASALSLSPLAALCRELFAASRTPLTLATYAVRVSGVRDLVSVQTNDPRVVPF